MTRSASADEDGGFGGTTEPDAPLWECVGEETFGAVPSSGTCALRADECRPNSAVNTDLGETIAAIARDCGAYCGQGTVGVREGCVSALAVTASSTVVSPADLQYCVRERVLGRRFACATECGWTNAYIGSCTLL